jgi:hypothetical protein
MTEFVIQSCNIVNIIISGFLWAACVYKMGNQDVCSV